MKGILGLLQQNVPPESGEEALDSKLFSTNCAGVAEPGEWAPWRVRAVEVGAARMDGARGTQLLQELWVKDKHMRHLETDAVARMEPFLEYSRIPAERDLIRQEERGDFMLVLLTGSIAVDRLQPWGERLRLTEAVPGEILGEMSLLDEGVRFSVCTTLCECEIATLNSGALDEMLRADPALTASFVTILARKLSLRLRVVSARISDQKR